MKALQILSIILFFLISNIKSQDIPYGLNKEAGRVVNTGDANIYY